MKNLFYSLFLLLLCGACVQEPQRETDVLKKINPFIGTDAHGHTYPGATVPFGMVQLSPDTRINDWDACSGYHYSDTQILGFSHTHLSGTGVGDYGDIRIMPTIGDVYWKVMPKGDEVKAYASSFSHANEYAEPAYYKVLMDNGIGVQLTADVHSGYHRYCFPAGAEANVILDLSAAVRTETIHDLQLYVVDNHTIKGLRRSGSWAKDQYCYFFIEFSKPFASYSLRKEGALWNDKTTEIVSAQDLQAAFTFDIQSDTIVELRVGLSACSMANAELNLRAEISEWDFEKLKNKAQKQWRDALQKIEVKGRKKDEEVFYTALYHSLLAPNIWSDVNGEYRGHDAEVHKADFKVYTVFSLWDTFRAEHPLLSLLYPEQSLDMIKSMLLMYEQGGLLPVWELAANETQCMIGYHAVPVIYDAYKQGITDFDAEKALQAMVKSAMQDKHGLDSYKQYGYVKADEEGESVSKTLEYAYDDWCIAQMAKDLGYQDIYNTFIQRAQYYKNVFSPEVGFMRAKLNGQWQKPFEPAEVNFHFTEANSWQYSMFVPQDVEGMVQLYGGVNAFEQKLDSLFHGSDDLKGRHQADITGLIGQYAHGNEPSHHMAYLYNYIGKPWKTQAVLRRITDELYHNKPDGLCGNEDCGQMSAWYVLSAMGVYPVCPGSAQWVIGMPKFEEVKLHLPNGKLLRFLTNKRPYNYPYIQSLSHKSEAYAKSYISYADLQAGGDWYFNMGREPNKKWGARAENRPHTSIQKSLICPVPYVDAPSRHFTDSVQLSLLSLKPEAQIYYTFGSEDLSVNSLQYSKPLVLRESALLRFAAYSKDLGWSKTVEAKFYKLDTNRHIELLSDYSELYTAGGDMALIDYVKGNDNFRTGTWQGYYAQDMKAVVAYQQAQRIKSVEVGFVQDQGSWIFLPKKVHFYTSNDKLTWQNLGSLTHDYDKQISPLVHRFKINAKGVKAKYVKVVAENGGLCPPWHLGAGSKSWLFADEIVIDCQ